ncbi:S1C family serine protease [Pseudoxanthomonas japonensis]|uniref:S1C family serine protease n=1 Tax=Pseudoxanthomonas japonensis TaxID=69284 RepID=UPI001BD14394|nr:PDZ domain-containing protein [Pseudoxanthomonas japonensis]MCR6625592.1 PDZ domain-containing protein [Pseudoxanthomonas sp.]
MRCLLPCLALFLCALAPAAHADTPPGRGFVFCSVTDTSHTPARVWASPVVEAEYPADDPAGFRRGLALADEFLAVVQARGGEGSKMCNVTATAQEAAQLRADAQATWNKRVFMMKVGDWREVAWTPKPWTPTAAPASLSRYFLCWATQTDLPERVAISRSVASGIIVREVPGARALEAAFALNEAYTREFQTVAQAHGVAAQATCSPYDSLAEAQHAQQAQRKLMDGFNQRYTGLDWEPSAAATATALTGASAPAAGPVVTPVAAPRPHGYCQVSRTAGDAMVWASPVFALPQPPSPAYSEALAARFKSAVVGLGGDGDATCWLHPEGAEAAGRMREHARTEWTTRMFARPGDWRDVPWSPDAEAPSSMPATQGDPPAVAAAPADRPAWGVRIEDLPQPLADVLGLTSAQGAWVRQVVAGSAAEAAGLQVMDVILQVDGETVVDAAQFAALARRSASGRRVPVQVWRKRQVQALTVTVPVATVAAPSATPASSSSDRYYCVAGISRHSPEQNFETPVREVAGNPADMAALSVRLSDLLASLTRSAPGWHAFGTPTCYPNGTSFPGENFCFASVMKRIRGVNQTAALFCNPSREGIDQRVQDMHKRATAAPAQALAWPE